MSEPNPDVARAHRVAPEIAAEHGVPFTYERVVDLIAYAYARGARDGYQEAAELGLQAFANLRDAFQKIPEVIR